MCIRDRRNIKPTKLLPLWDLMGVTLGFGTAMLGEKAAMLCTASVEEVIDEHYKDQTFKLGNDETKLKEKIKKFRQDELDHKEIAYDNGATKKGLFGILDLFPNALILFIFFWTIINTSFPTLISMHFYFI